VRCDSPKHLIRRHSKISKENVAFAPFYLAFGDVKWTTLPQKESTKHLIAVLRGSAIAAPILLIFGGFFMAADAIFQGIIEETKSGA